MRKTGLMLLCLVLFQLIISCNKTDDGTYTAPITVYERMYGSWTLTKITQTDLIAVAMSTDPDQMNLTNELNFKTFAITFNVDDAFNPTTFEVGGTSPEMFIKTGYWKLNNPFPNTDGTALVIELYSDESKTQLADKLSITAVPGAKAVLQFSLIRESNSIPYVSYEYSLKKAN